MLHLNVPHIIQSPQSFSSFQILLSCSAVHTQTDYWCSSSEDEYEAWVLVAGMGRFVLFVITEVLTYHPRRRFSFGVERYTAQEVSGLKVGPG